MPPLKKKAPRKEEDDDEELDDLEEEEQEGSKKRKKPAAKPKSKQTEAFTDDMGWTNIPGEQSLIYKDFGSKASDKIASFDLDGTLIAVKSGAKFAKNADDWRLFNKKVPKELKKHHDEGCRIVVFSNQMGIKAALDGKAAANVKGRVENFMAELRKLGVPALVMFAPAENDMRKPSTGMWKYMCSNLNGGISPEKSKSFFVGDMAGRDSDHNKSSSDRDFAGAIGIGFKTPEEAFGEPDGKINKAVVAEDAGVTENAKIISMFEQLAEQAFNSGEDKANFKGLAYKNAAKSLATFPQPITLGNIKEVAKLPKVGKATVDKIKSFLETGELPSPLRGGAAAAKAQQDLATDANAFM